MARKVGQIIARGDRSSLGCREIRQARVENREKWPEFCNPFLSNLTGESVLLNTACRVCDLSLRRAQEHYGFNDSVRRMLCDHKPMKRRCRLDFVRTGSIASEIAPAR
jgi:hypothetical protein